MPEIPSYLKDRLLSPAPKGFTKIELSLLGVSWPPQKGWKREVLRRLELETEYARAKAEKKKDAKAKRREEPRNDPGRSIEVGDPFVPTEAKSLF